MLFGLEPRPRRRAVAQTSLGSCVRITGITGIRYFEKVSKMSRRHGPHSVSRDGKIPDLPDSGDSVGNDWVEVKSRDGPTLPRPRWGLVSESLESGILKSWENESEA